MIENLIFENLVYNEQYARKVLPFLKHEYFQQPIDKALFQLIEKHFVAFNTCPTKDVLNIELEKVNTLSDEQYKEALNTISSFNQGHQNLDWLVSSTESFCQDKAIYNAVMESISIIDGRQTKKDKGSIPGLLSDALAVSFDSNIGHDFIDDSEDRFALYHDVQPRIPFDLEYFNIITKGGLLDKTLTVFLAGTGIGKSLAMCHLAAYNLIAGKNVLYITLEMAEERIAERIDANLLNVAVDELAMLPKDTYFKKIQKIKENTPGRLIIKEYPTGSAGSNNFRFLINELKLKKSFIPDIIYIDYLNICMSSRIKHSANVNSYSYIKAIAEELRGLAVENKLPIVTATQVTRSGFTSSDIGLEDTSESFGLPATADLMLALISTEELAGLNQIMVKQLKSRYSDINKNRRFVIGIDRAKMKLYNVEQSAQEDIVDDAPVFDQSKTGAVINAERKFKPTVFEDFN